MIPTLAKTLTLIPYPNQHRHHDVIHQTQLLALAKDGVPQQQQILQGKLAPKQQTQPPDAEDRQRNVQLQQVVVKVQILLDQDFVLDVVELLDHLDLGFPLDGNRRSGELWRWRGRRGGRCHGRKVTGGRRDEVRYAVKGRDAVHDFGED